MLLDALSIVYPAATQIVAGQKTLEIRSWKPPTVPVQNLLIVENRRRLDHAGDIDPDGLAVAVIDIEEVRDWTEEDARKDGHVFVTGYYAWVISNVRPIDFPARVQAERLIYKVTIPDRTMITVNPLFFGARKTQ
ncbi:MAG: ASCH domain-containing protein [Methylacidiphilales bacterium]|nr:ASCH domain-containing protein [Candidatus Methylacidiphilales bacterium]